MERGVLLFFHKMVGSRMIDEIFQNLSLMISILMTFQRLRPKNPDPSRSNRIDGLDPIPIRVIPDSIRDTAGFLGTEQKTNGFVTFLVVPLTGY